MKILWMAIAGSAGTLLRYWLGGFIQAALGGAYPWGTFAVNMAGCLFFGLVWTITDGRITIGPDARAIALTGFMGAFTTFSTLMFDTVDLMRGPFAALSLVNLVSQNVLGVVLIALGMALGRLF
jgi:CrcB protein